MTSTRRAYCPECGALLRRGQPIGALCDPCQNGGPDPSQVLPADFYDQPRIVAPLGVYDFGLFFRRLRTQADWSQQTLGTVIDMHQGQISAIERGAHRLRDIQAVARIATRLVIPPARLGFPDIGTNVVGGVANRQKVVSWVDRRDFGQYVAASILSAAGLDVDRLIALLPQSEPIGTRHVGVADVAIIEQATAAFVRQDFAHGSGLIRDAAVTQLQSALPLLKAEVNDEVKPQLLIAAARLAMQTGWMSFQCHQNDAARRLWMIGLSLARMADHPLATDLIVYSLYNMALQAVHLDRPDEALHLIQTGHTVSKASQYPVSASTACALAQIQATAHAAQGDATGCDRAQGQTIEHFAAIEATTRPPWGGFISEVSLSSFRGTANYSLALTNRDARAADRAVSLLRHAVDHYGPDYARLRGASLSELAGAHALAEDVDTAVTVGHQAIDHVIALSSPLAYDHLRTLHTALEPLHASPGVADLRARLTAIAA